LGQERAVLKIEALKQLGAEKHADDLKQQFRSDNPTSPYLEESDTSEENTR
jgi:hypothetical protein